MRVYRYRDFSEEQYGFWFWLDGGRHERTDVLKWCRNSLGIAGRLCFSSDNGIYYTNASKTRWSKLENSFVVFWDVEAAALFLTFYETIDD